MINVVTIISVILKNFFIGIILFLFGISSVYVFMFKKKDTGIIRDYVITALFLLIVLWRVALWDTVIMM